MAKTRIDKAIDMASKAHAGQLRKGTDIPYISHPLAVAMILSQHGCSEDEIIAGILHDTLEDTEITFEQISEQFGPEVARLVTSCSEPDGELSWEERKQNTIEKLKIAPDDVRRVSCADKLHNIRSIAEDYSQIGDKLWDRFKRGKEDLANYYRSLADSFCDKESSEKDRKLFEEFKAEVGKVF